MRKRVLIFILIFMLIISLVTGCGKPANNESAVQQEATSEIKQETEEFKLFDENGNPLNPPRDAVAKNGIVSTQKYEASKIGAEILEICPGNLIQG